MKYELHHAALNGDVARVRTLLRGGDINVDELAPVGTVARANHLAIITNSQAITAKTGFLTPLHCAAGMGNVEIVELLIKGGAAIDAVGSGDNSKDMTPLIMAVDKQKITTARILLEAGASVNPAPGLRPRGTALMSAVLKNNVDLVDILLENGADHAHISVDGLTALNLAAAQGHTVCCERLLKAGAVDKPCGSGILYLSALAMAPVSGDWRKEKEITELLLQYGSDVNARLNKGKSALCLLAENGNVNGVRLLIQKAKGLKINHRDDENSTPLMKAAIEGHTAVVSVLLAAGASVAAANKDGSPMPAPLHVAIRLMGDANDVADLMEKAYLHEMAVAAKRNRQRNSSLQPPMPPANVIVCANPGCNATEQRDGSTGKLKVCGGCKCVRYCSAECSKEHWKVFHKQSCAKICLVNYE